MTETNDTRFKPGQSGNPAGRPAGARTKKYLMLDEMAEKAAEDIATKFIDLAKAGDGVAGRLILERIWPPRKGARISFDLPEVTRADELPAAIASVNRQVAEGDLAPEEGTLIVGLLDAQRRAIETNDLAQRLAAIEDKLAGRKR